MDLNITKSDFIRVSDVKISDIFYRRLQTGINKIDEFMSGGFLPGSSFTLAASPGTGKTTLMLQILESLAKQGYKVGYISGEENVEQLAFTSKRLNVNRVPLANITDIDDLCKAIVDEKCDFVVIDSLPAITSKKKMNKKKMGCPT